MILVDTSVWIDHLRATDKGLIALLNSHQVLVHPFVIGELACGNLKA
jgi:predicted nucleic acid-binding protein